MTYTELHCHSHYSLLDGASSPGALAARAAALGMGALALTDHDALYGAVEFQRAAEGLGVRPIFGAELTLEDGSHLTLLVEDERGWARLGRWISAAQAAAPKGEARLPRALLEGGTDGLLCLSGCRAGTLARLAEAGDEEGAVRHAAWLAECFPGRLWVELQHHLAPGDERRMTRLAWLAARTGLPVVATNNAHYAERERHRLQELLSCVRQGTTLYDPARRHHPNSERYLKGHEEMARLFRAYPEALRATEEIAARCDFRLPVGIQPLPPFPTPPGLDAEGYLRQLCEGALPARYGHASDEARRQLDHELAVIGRAGLANYFLVVWDVVRFCRSESIRCQGRGSAGNSLVAYLLGISPVEPLGEGLLFERFLSDERPSVPDIDLDLQADRREEAIRYLYDKYGDAHVAMACTLIRYRARSALRDAGKALALPEAELARVARLLDGRDVSTLAHSPELAALAEEGAAWRLLAELTGEMADIPRHLGLHNGGMVLSDVPLAERVPVEPAALAGRTVVQWDKEMLEEAGIIKVDLLGLKMLSVLDEAERALRERGVEVDLEALSPEDPAVYALLERAETIGIFQLESRAQAQVLPRLKLRSFADIIVAISLIRPGPIQGEMVHPYLRRRRGEEPVMIPHPLLERALRPTLGVLLFQEQVLLVARDLTGFSGGEGEQLRRALGKGSDLTHWQRHFLAGARQRGVDEATAQAVWESIVAFGGYAFPKSHAAAFARLVYQSAWLKVYHPAPFFAGLLNHQPMGFWAPSVLVGEARRSGVAVLPVDVTCSGARCTLEGKALRLGLSYVSGLGEQGAARIVAAREGGSFRDLENFCRRTQLPKPLVEGLIRSGALDALGARRALLWDLGPLRYAEEELALPWPDDGVTLPPLGEIEAQLWERETMGLSPRPHLLAHYRSWLAQQGILGSRALARAASGRTVRVAGQIVVHQAPPTAKGTHFLSLEDEDGLVDVILRAERYGAHRAVVRTTSLLLVEGTLQRRDGAVSVVAERVAPLRAAGAWNGLTPR